MKCDFCGKELKITAAASVRIVRSSSDEIYDLLCEDCASKFMLRYEELKQNIKQPTKQDNLKDMKYLLYCTLGGIMGGIIPNVVKWLIF